MKNYGSNMLNRTDNTAQQNDTDKNEPQNNTTDNKSSNIFVKNPETSKYKTVEEINQDLLSDEDDEDINLTLPVYQSKHNKNIEQHKDSSS